MRIIGGKFKGRHLAAPQLGNTRPTTDLARESLFNILNSTFEIEGKTVLDLFSGTGSVAFEFLSRGATEATCVDSSRQGLAFIKENAEKWECKVRCVKNDVFRFLALERNTYDVIFADPPYENKHIAEIPDYVFKRQLLNKDGLLIVEHGKDTDLSGFSNFTGTRRYGRVNFSFFENK